RACAARTTSATSNRRGRERRRRRPEETEAGGDGGDGGIGLEKRSNGVNGQQRRQTLRRGTASVVALARRRGAERRSYEIRISFDLAPRGARRREHALPLSAAHFDSVPSVASVAPFLDPIAPIASDISNV